MLGLSVWDWAAIAAYLIGITIIGVWTAVKIKDTADFFMGGRTHNRWFMMFFAFGAGTSGNDAVGVSSKTYTSGMSGIWYQWLWLFATPFYWLIAPVMRRMRCLTTGDYFHIRYDGSVEALYSVIGVLQLTFNMGILLLGGSMMIEAVSGGAIPHNVSIVAMTILFLAYGMAGGLTAAIITDFIQGILTVVLSFMLLPVALKHVGGWTGLREKIGDPQIFTIVSPGEINTLHIVMMCFSALIGIVTQPHIMGVCSAGRTEMDGRFGFASGNLLKRFCTIAWMIVGLCGIAMYPGLAGKEIDQVYGKVAADLLPTVMPGLIGIFLAALLASIMSSCDAFMVSSSGLFTQNFYRKYVKRDQTEGHYVTVGRIVSLVIVSTSLGLAFTISSVPVALEWFFKIQALMAASFWLGLFWRRTTVAGAWAGILSALGVLFLCEWPGMQPWWVANAPEYMIWADKLRLSYSLVFYLSTAFGVTVLVSLASRRLTEAEYEAAPWIKRAFSRAPEAKLDQLFACIRTPVVSDEAHAAPFTLPPGVEAGNPPKIINHPDFEIYWPSKVSVIGFLIFWAWVVALIGFVYWLAGFRA